jgi:hypothetical protein
MIVAEYGMRDLVIQTLGTCSDLPRKEWSKAFQTFTFFKGFVKDAFLVSIMKRNLKRGRKGYPPLPWSLFTMISWVHFHICPSIKKFMSSHLLMITHAILRVYFLK